MGATISVVRASNPDGVNVAAGELQRAVADLQKHIPTQQGLLRSLGQNWVGETSKAAVTRGDRIMESQMDFREQLQVGDPA